MDRDGYDSLAEAVFPGVHELLNSKIEVCMPFHSHTTVRNAEPVHITCVCLCVCVCWGGLLCKSMGLEGKVAFLHQFINVVGV